VLLPANGYVRLNIGGDELQELYVASDAEYKALFEYALRELFYHLHHAHTGHYRVAGKVAAENVVVCIELYPATVLVVGLLDIVGGIKVVVEQVREDKLIKIQLQ
jgi:hypothetical protein